LNGSQAAESFGEKHMSQTKRLLASSKWATLVALLLFVPLVLLACGEPTAAPTEPPVAKSTATTVAAAPATATSAPTEEPTEPPAPTEPPTEPPPTEPPPTDTPEPTEEPTPVVVDDSACITCHTSEETLKAMATEEEETESLSEGEG
jgi:hypothetical protein